VNDQPVNFVYEDLDLDGKGLTKGCLYDTPRTPEKVRTPRVVPNRYRS